MQTNWAQGAVMDIQQLRTFVAVAREGSITRASERVHLSQPAVSAHIKAMEDTLGLALFERTPRGMDLTRDGERLLERAEQTLAAHRALLEEAARIKSTLTGRLRLGMGCNSGTEALGHLMTGFAERYPQVDVVLRHGTSRSIAEGVRNGSLDAGFYNETGEPEADLSVVEISRFAIYLAGPPGTAVAKDGPDWRRLADLPWICPAPDTCCGEAAEALFCRHNFRPERIISVDREQVTRTLIAGGVGVGLLHADAARAAEATGEVELICDAQAATRLLFACLGERVDDPLLRAANAIVTATL